MPAEKESTTTSTVNVIAGVAVAAAGAGLIAWLVKEHYKPRRPMTDTELVRSTWAKVDPAVAGPLFYTNLFEEAPSVKALFKGSDLHKQAEKLMRMIGSAVKLLDKPDELVPVLRELGKKHVRYGAVPAHYPVVGSAFLKTLSQGLGDAFTEEARGAWTRTYGVIADTMMAGAADAEL